MGTDQTAATRVAFVAGGSKEGTADTEEKEKELAVEEKEGRIGDEPDR